MRNTRNLFICSPYRAAGENAEVILSENIALAKRVCRKAVMEGYNVFCPHIFFTQFLDDDKPSEREIGMAAGLEQLKLCDELWVVGNNITEGMSREIAIAGELGKRITCVCDPRLGEERILDAIMK